MVVPPPRTLLASLGFAAAAALLLPLPWLTAPRAPVVLVGTGPATRGEAAGQAGWELAGPVTTTLLVALVVAAAVLLAVRRSGAARVVLVLAGATGVAVGAGVLVGRGASLPAAAAAVCGAAAAVLAALGLPAILAVALLAAVVPVLPGGPVNRAAPDTAAPDTGGAAGPFVRVARLDAAAAVAVVVDGRAGVVTAGGLTVLDAAGNAEVLATTPDGPPERASIIGAAGGRVVRWSAADAVTVTGLDERDPVAVTVHGVSAASPLGADGTLWVRATSDPPGTARLLDLAQRDGEQTADATYLPVFAIHGPTASAAVDVATLLPVGTGAIRAVPQEAGQRLERLSGDASGHTTVTLLAGGLDATCGLTRSGPASFLPQPGPLAADGEGGVWFVTGPAPDGRLARLGPDGELRVVAAPLPGVASSMVVTPDGEPVLTLADAAGPALWRLPDPAAALTDLPAPAPGCAAPLAPLAPPVALVPVSRTGRDRLGIPLGADGRWASAGPGGEIAVVAPGGARTPVGVRADGGAGPVWPDGSGGVWWVEAPGTPVHGTAAGTDRFPQLRQDGSELVPDLGGRPPLLVTATGAFRVGSRSPLPVVGGRVAGGVVRADGRGWLLADGGLIALDGDHMLGAVIDPGDRRADTTPVAVQLAKGVAPAALALPRATVALDGAGR
ncbi:hypothetical protein ACFSCY_13315, partial [Pseudonocardia aurantiaca]